MINILLLYKKLPKIGNNLIKITHPIAMEVLAENKSNKIIKSALFLTIAGFITKIIGVLYKVPLLEIVGSEGLGYYQLVFPVFVFTLILSSGGITTTLSKTIAKCETQNQKKLYLKICLLQSLFFSVTVALLLVIFCKKIALFQGGENLCISYKVLAPALIFCAITSSLRGYFQGQNNMKNTAWSQIIEQVGKISLGLFFSYVFIKQSVLKSIFGAFLGLTISEAISAIFLTIIYFNQKNKIKERYSLNEVKIAIKNFNKELVPITLTALISPLFGAINSLLIVDLLIKAGLTSSQAVMLFGLSGVVISLVGIPSIVSGALSTTIFPQICSLSKTEDEKDKIISLSYKLIFAICLPCVFVFLIFSKPIVSLLYSDGLSFSGFNQLEIASRIIKIVSTMVLYSSLSSFTTTLLQAKNKSFNACKNLLFGCLITLISFVFLTKLPQINVLGDSLAILIGTAITAVLNLSDLKKINAINLNIKDIFFAPILSSIIMVIVMQILLCSLSGVIASKILTLFVCGVGFLVYVLMIFVLKVFNFNEIWALKPSKQSKN